MKTPWIRPRKYWFVLTPDSLDYYSSNEKGARRLGSLVLTSLCSVLWPDKQLYKETGEEPMCPVLPSQRSFARRMGDAEPWGAEPAWPGCWWPAGERVCPSQATGV